MFVTNTRSGSGKGFPVTFSPAGVGLLGSTTVPRPTAEKYPFQLPDTVSLGRDWEPGGSLTTERLRFGWAKDGDTYFPRWTLELMLMTYDEY